MDRELLKERIANLDEALLAISKRRTPRDPGTAARLTADANGYLAQSILTSCMVNLAALESHEAASAAHLAQSAEVVAAVRARADHRPELESHERALRELGRRIIAMDVASQGRSDDGLTPDEFASLGSLVAEVVNGLPAVMAVIAESRPQAEPSGV